MEKLYPFKFKPQPKPTIWGGNALQTLFNKNFPADKQIGESWELSSVQRSLSVVSNGFLKGNNIEELAEIYMGELLGEKIYEHYGVEFPVLIKLIDARQTLSVQVHPDDEVALERHNAYGKTEMWYVLQAEPEAVLYIGFNRDTTAQEFYERVQDETLLEILNAVKVKSGDAFFIPPGTIHAIGKGIVLAEVQQTSDITYRVYDWGREHDAELARDMHIEHAIDVIDYTKKTEIQLTFEKVQNSVQKIKHCPYFTTNFLDLTKPLQRNLLSHDSFVVYICLEGNLTIQYNSGTETITKGETILIPAAIADITLIPAPTATLLEVFVE